MGEQRIAAAAGFCGMLLAVLAFSPGTLDYVFLSIFFSAGAMLCLFVPKPQKRYKSRDRTVTAKEVTASPFSRIFISIEGKVGAVRRLRLWNEKVITGMVPASGTPHDPEKMATSSTRFALTAAPAAAAGVGLAVHLDMLALVALAGLPAVLFVHPWMHMKLSIAERKVRIEEEMAYFLCYVNIMQTVGHGLYSAFRQIRGWNVFPAMEKDAREVVKSVEMLGNTQNDSLEKYGKSHPSKPFGDFINGYIAKITSVGNVPAYTESKANYFFDEYLGSWERYEKSAQEIFSAIFMISIIIPMMMAFNSIIGTSASASLLLLLGIMISPVVSVLMIIMLNSSQPATGSRLPVAYFTFVAGAAVGIFSLAAGADPATSLALACFVGAIANYATVKSQVRGDGAIESAAPEFMRDVTEISKTGQNVSQIIQRQAGRRSYNGHFNRLLEDMALDVRVGESFDQAAMDVRAKSTHVRFIFFLLARTYVTGGGSTDIFNSITEFITKINQKKSQIRKGLSSLTLLVFAAPFIMLGVSHIMVGMFADMEPESNAGMFGSFSGIDPSLVHTIAIMSVTTCVPMGVVASKIANFTVKNTLPVAIVSLTTILAIHVTPALVAGFGFG